MKALILIFLGLLLAGCATGFHVNNGLGGYSEMQLNKDTYLVNFSGNRYTNPNRVGALILYRCAQLTLNNGYKYFVILNSSQQTSQYNMQIIQPRATTYYNGEGNYSGFGNMGTYNYSGSANTIYNPGIAIPIRKVSDNILIKMFRSNKGLPAAIDAKIIMGNFTQKSLQGM